MKINNKHFKTIWYDKNTDKINIINQLKLPHFFETLHMDTFDGIINAIKTMNSKKILTSNKFHSINNNLFKFIFKFQFFLAMTNKKLFDRYIGYKSNY